MKRRRSPRRCQQKGSLSPSPKRQKLERKDTVEIESNPEQGSTILERKTSSFLEDVDKKDSISTLSSSNRNKLFKRLSSIMNPTDFLGLFPNTIVDRYSCITEPEPMYVGEMEALLEIVPFPDECGTVRHLSVESIIAIFSYLPDDDRFHLSLTCKRMRNIFICFLDHEYAPIPISYHIQTSQMATNFILLREHTTKNIPHKAVVEARALEEHIKKTGDIPAIAAQQLCLCLRNTDSYSWHSEWHGKLEVAPACQPKGLALTLYEYQALGLSWMLSIERMARTKQKVTYSTLLHLPRFRNIACNTHSEDPELVVVSPQVYKNEKYQNSFTTQGGMFGDEMGLGKTISMLALILSNPRPQPNGKYADCLGQNDKTAVQFQSKATLVLCPSQLVAQWAKEISAHTKLVCYTAATAAQHRKLTYKKLIEADVVIIAYKFLATNPSYRGFCAQTITPQLSHTSPVIHKIGWHRVILDEGHEILSSELLDFSGLYSNYRWYVTGTPLPLKQDSLYEALDFIHCKPDISPFKKYGQGGPMIYYRAVKRALFWRNTKDSIGTQVEIPPVNEEIEIVHLSPIEQTIYDALCFEPRNHKIRREFISEPNKYLRYTVRGSTLGNPTLPQMFINHFQQLFKAARQRLKHYQQNIKDCKAELSRKGITREERTRAERNLKAGKKMEKDEEDKIVQLICQIACFCRLLVGETSNDICDGCDEYATGRSKVECGHHLCYQCIQKVLETEYYPCTKCNATVNFSKVQLSDENLPQIDLKEMDSEDDAWFNGLRIEYGSKFAATARYLKNIMTNAAEDVKMIVFSQYESALFQLCSVLEDVDYETFANKIVMCKGNVHARKNQLARFTAKGEDSARILLLSLKNSASGTHLAAATHVLLLDPVVGTSGEAQATDAQAIARAHRIGQDELVTAIRFIVVRTIDQTDYENAYGAVLIPRGLGPKSARK